MATLWKKKSLNLRSRIPLAMHFDRINYLSNVGDFFVGQDDIHGFDVFFKVSYLPGTSTFPIELVFSPKVYRISSV